MEQQAVLSTDRLFIHHSVSHSPSSKYDLHCHNYAEVFLFIDGDVQYLVEGREYRPRPMSVLLIPSGVFHGVRILSERDYNRYALHFLPDLISTDVRRLLLAPFSGQNLYFTNCENCHLPSFFDEILSCAELPEELRQAALRARTESLLVQVCALAEKDGAGVEDSKDRGDWVFELIEFINEQYQRPVTLEELSERFYISKNQINRAFRKATGTTVFNYISHKRIALARQLVLSGVPAQEASLRAGFGDYSNFFRQYRKILGHTPTQAHDHALL